MVPYRDVATDLLARGDDSDEEEEEQGKEEEEAEEGGPTSQVVERIQDLIMALQSLLITIQAISLVPVQQRTLNPRCTLRQTPMRGQSLWPRRKHVLGVCWPTGITKTDHTKNQSTTTPRSQTRPPSSSRSRRRSTPTRLWTCWV